MRLSASFTRALQPIRWLDIVDRVTLVFGAVVVAVLTLLTTADVTGRYVFNQPIVGTYEVTQLMLVAIVFTGIAAVQAEHGHVRAEFLINRIRQGRPRILIELLALAFGLTAFGLIGWEGWLDFLRAWRTQDFTMGLINVPTWPGKIWIPLGSALIFLRLLQHLAEELYKLAKVGRHQL